MQVVVSPPAAHRQLHMYECAHCRRASGVPSITRNSRNVRNQRKKVRSKRNGNGRS